MPEKMREYLKQTLKKVKLANCFEAFEFSVMTHPVRKSVRYDREGPPGGGRGSVSVSVPVSVFIRIRRQAAVNMQSGGSARLTNGMEIISPFHHPPLWQNQA